MPVRKFRTLEEWQASKQSAWLACDDPRVPDRIQAHWKRWSSLVPISSPRGVRKYRSIDEANADRDRWEQERIDRLRAERLRK